MSSTPPAAALTMQQELLSKAAITAWVNTTLGTTYGDIKAVPAKAAARLLDAIFGRRFDASSRIEYADALLPTQLHNAEVVLRAAARLGCESKLAPEAWLDGDSFAQLLLFWRWLRQAAADIGEVFPPTGFDFSIEPPPITTLPGISLPPGDHTPAPPGVPPGQLESTPLSFAVAPLPDRTAVAATVAAAEAVVAASSDGSFPIAGGQPRCAKCGPTVERLTAPAVRRLMVLRRATADLERAVADKDVQGIIAALEIAV